MRAHHLRTPTAVSRVNGIPRQSTQRQGNCMKRSFGRTFHSGLEIDSMSNVQAATQNASEHQSSELRVCVRQRRAAQAATIVRKISATETQEITRLKAS